VARIGNESDAESSGATSSGGPFAELLRLQTEFQARLTEETLRYMRRLQGAAGPSVPGTVVLADAAVRLDAAAAPGESVELRLEVENRQRMHCAVTPALSPLLDSAGATWFPAAETLPPSLLLAPGEVANLTVSVKLPSTLPAGTYRGALLLQGFRDRGVPVSIQATEPPGAPVKRRTRRAAKPA
jgi:hypothetical protein